MPTRVEFAIRSLEQHGRQPLPAPRVCPPQRLHGLACRLFEGPANEFFPHHGQLKPFSVSPLLHRGGDRVEWWTTWMPDDLVPPVLGAAVDAQLGDQPIRLEPAGIRHRSFGSLRQHEPVERANVVFLSPTRFSRNGVSWVLPDPFLLFGSLERRWRWLAPPDLAPPTKLGTELARLTHVAAADITTVRTDHLGGVTVWSWAPFRGRYLDGPPASRASRGHPGFVGSVTFELRSSDEEHARWFGASLSFAELAGVGAGTTHGLGTVVVHPNPSAAELAASLRVSRPARTDHRRGSRRANTNPGPTARPSPFSQETDRAAVRADEHGSARDTVIDGMKGVNR